ncbi:MAG: tetratricopeptide repeat protein [Polyangiales bacterium]
MRLRDVALAVALTLAAPAARADNAAARAALARGDYAGAEAALRRPRANERAAADRMMGEVLLATGRYDEARALGERMGRSPSTRAAGLTLEGEALAAVGRYDDAVARWRSAYERGPAAQSWRARALAAQWCFRLGRMDDVRDASNGLIDAYNDATDRAGNADAGARRGPLADAEFLTYVGVAARARGALRNANEVFNEALRVDPRNVEANVEQAELMLATEDLRPGGQALRAALEVNPHHPRALVLRARTRLASDLDLAHARDDLEAALAVNPRLPSALATEAAIALRDGDVAEAERLLARAEAVNPRDLDVMTARGVARFRADDMEGFRRHFDALFALSPTRAEAYETLADFADWEHRYDEAITLLREGLARPAMAADPRLAARVRAFLGLNLLRTGREDDGLRELRASFDASRFNVRVANVLNFYERTVPTDYVTETEGPFRIRYHREERAILRRFVPDLLRRAWADMVRRYGFTPEGPISIELFADVEHFSVRTAGVPEIGVQGVCFGRVVTALSPRGGPFNWAQILWHELGHVFAIQRSRSRVPRWFTEGLSEWEAFHADPHWSREEDPALARALRAGRVPRVADFNTAFTHARRPEDLTVAYYAASRLVEHIIDRYGFDRAAAMLPLWGAGRSTPDVVQQALGVSADALDASFRASLAPRLARYTNAFDPDPNTYRDREALERAAGERPSDADAQADAAAATMLAGEAESAARFAEASIRLVSATPLARWVRARLAMARRDPREALTELDVIFTAGADGYELRVFEARAAAAARDDARARRALEAATRLDPTQVEAFLLLARLHERARRDDDRLAALREVVRLDQHDRRALRQLIETLLSRSAWTEIRDLARHAVQLDPESPATHYAIGQALTELGDRAGAAAAYEAALDLNPANAAEVRARIEAVRRGQRGLAPLRAPAPSRPQGQGQGQSGEAVDDDGA